MDEINALVSNRVPTKSIEQSIAPILSQVSQLILLGEKNSRRCSAEYIEEKGCQFFAKCKAASKAALKLSKSISDETLKNKLQAASFTLTENSENFLVCSKKLTYSLEDTSSFRQLTRSIKDVVESLIKVLLIADERDIKKIVNMTEQIEEDLNSLLSREHQKELASDLKKIYKTSIEMVDLCDNRTKNLRKAKQKQALNVSISTFKRNIPLLCEGLRAIYRKSSSDKLKRQLSEDFAVAQMKKSLREIRKAIEGRYLINEDDDNDSINVEEAGCFTLTIDLAMERLSTNDDITNEINSILRHSLTVGHAANECFKDSIKKISQIVLQAKNKYLQCLEVENRDKLPDIKAIVQEGLQHLERQVNGAVLGLIIDAFKESVEPLDRVIKRVLLSEISVCNAPTGNTLDDLIENFHSHSDMICQASRLVSASCPDTSKVKVIQTAVQQLEALDPELIPAILLCHANKKNKDAILQIKLLRNEWSDCVKNLIITIDKITDPNKFILLTNNQLNNEIDSICKCTQISFKLLADVKAVLGKTGRVCTVAKSIINQSEPNDFNKNLATFLKNLLQCIPSVRTVINQIEQADNCDTLLSILSEKCEILHQNMRYLADGLDKENHEKILADMNKTVEYRFHNSEMTMEGDKTISNDEHFDFSILLTDSSDVKRLADEIELSAISSKRQKVDVLCNDLLTYSNVLVDNATTLAEFDQQNKRMLHDVSSDITTLSINVIDSSRKVVLDDSARFDDLKKYCRTWAIKVTKCENIIAAIVQIWTNPVEIVIEALQNQNVKDINSSLKYLEQITNKCQEISADIKWIINQTKAINDGLINEQENELENTLSTISTYADLAIGSRSIQAKNALKQALNTWKVKIHVINLLLINVSKEYIQRTCVEISIPKDINSLDGWKLAYENCLSECNKIKNWLEPVITGQNDLAIEARRSSQLLDMEQSKLTESYNLLINCNDDPFVTLKLCLNILRFSKVMNDTSNILDEAVKEIFPCLANMADSFRSISLSFSPSKVENCISEEFQKKLTTLKSKISDCLSSLPTDKRRTVIELSEWLDKLTIELLKIIEPDSYPFNTKEFVKSNKLLQKLQYEWISLFSRVLNELKGYTDISEFKMSPRRIEDIDARKEKVFAGFTESLRHDLIAGSSSSAVNSALNTFTKSMTGLLSCDTFSLDFSKILSDNENDESLKVNDRFKQNFHSTPITGFPKRHFMTMKSTNDKQRITQLDNFYLMKSSLLDLRRFIYNKDYKNTSEIALSIVEHCNEVLEFFRDILKNCFDDRLAKDLQSTIECLPTVLNQLKVIIKLENDHNRSERGAEQGQKIILKNCSNVIRLTRDSFIAAHACCSCLVSCFLKNST
ncbi:DgyrCDS10535 [Dimorphilus gyrociliatus]|uniref:DgyrCDS10535 n=1 Tax=Dimorphilus gyrociliatus TaxID=2664684 RepID=A0A7I8W5L7_9ANNE|nr:DgyrCDS10535 [Dimorphilus gyrociliatus]